MKVSYSEKLVEDLIKEFPKELLGEPLELLYQQPIIGGYIPDLIFKDENGSIVIVEIQINELDRLHLYKCLEYRDLYLHNKDPNAVIRLIVFANSIPNKLNPILKTHSIKGIAFNKEVLIKKIKSLKPSLKILRSKKELQLTSLDILKKINRAELKYKNSLNLNAIIFYQFSHRSSYDEYYRHLNFNLLYFKDYPKRYRRDYNSHIDLNVNVPTEIIVHEKLETLEIDQLRTIESWLDNLGKYYIIEDYSDFEVILGYRGYLDYFGYEDYLKDRIKTFQPLWRMYGKEQAYETEKIAHDLELINSILLFTGKYPDYVPKPLFEKFEIEEGAGSLEENWDNRLETISKFKKDPVEVERIIQQKEVDCNKYKWTTVNIINLNASVLEVLRELIWHILAGHIDYNPQGSNLNLSRKCHICHIPPKQFSKTNLQFLRKSSQYFEHVKK